MSDFKENFVSSEIESTGIWYRNFLVKNRSIPNVDVLHKVPKVNKPKIRNFNSVKKIQQK